MAVTTTANTTPAILHVLKDYEIHHGTASPPRSGPLPNSCPDVANTTLHSNPPSWPTRHREIPPRKPVRRDLDKETRPGGANIPEKIFIAVLLNGCRILGNMNTAWRATGGRINDRIFQYEIGGEW